MCPINPNLAYASQGEFVVPLEDITEESDIFTPLLVGLSINAVRALVIGYDSARKRIAMDSLWSTLQDMEDTYRVVYGLHRAYRQSDRTPAQLAGLETDSADCNAKLEELITSWNGNVSYLSGPVSVYQFLYRPRYPDVRYDEQFELKYRHARVLTQIDAGVLQSFGNGYDVRFIYFFQVNKVKPTG